MGSSTLRLSEYARCFVYPPGIARTVWPRVEAKGRELGLGFDWWQSQLGTVCLGYGEDGKYVATVGGVGLSIPRQVGKTYFALALLVIMCILFPGLQVVWTTHHLRTSTKTFSALQGICRRKKVAPYIAKNNHGRDAIRTANGEQEVTFNNGSKIMFGSRKAGFGRGFDEIDVEVFDEAQILDMKTLEDMIAATNQARHEHGALLFFMGTPPRPLDDSEAYSERRREALEGEADQAIWLEIGADPKSSPDDRTQWPLMNPSFPTRTPVESLLRLRKNLKSEDSWNREGRGIWDDDGPDRGLDYAKWLDLADPDAPRGANPVFGVATAPDRSWSAVGVAWKRPDGGVQVMLAEYRETTTWVAEHVAGLRKKWGGRVLVDVASRDLVFDAEELSQPEMAKAHNALSDAVTASKVHHGNERALNVAVKAARWRSSGDTRVLDRKGEMDVSPLAAVALAAYGAAQPPTKPGRFVVI